MTTYVWHEQWWMLRPKGNDWDTTNECFRLRKMNLMIWIGVINFGVWHLGEKMSEEKLVRKISRSLPK